MVMGLSHVTLLVKDLEKTSALLEKVLGAKEVYSSGDRLFSLSREKFFLMGDLWICIMQGEPLAERTYNHIAFQIPDDEFDDYHAQIKGIGLEIEPGRSRVDGEGRSLYFYDYDNHLFELHTGILGERLRRYAQAEQHIKFARRD